VIRAKAAAHRLAAQNVPLRQFNDVFPLEGYEVFGVDSDAQAIANVRRLAQFLAPAVPAENFREETIEKMSFPSSFADVVLSSAVLETWPLARLIPYVPNPRKNDHVVNRMVASIQEFGFRIPVLARSSGEIIDGHLRIKAAEKLGMTEAPVIPCDDWTDAQVKAFRLLVNRSVNWADWDTELLSLEMLDLKGLDFDLTLTGFDGGEIDALLLGDEPDAAEDVVPDLPEKAVSVAGDLWLLGPHRVLCAATLAKKTLCRACVGQHGLT